MTAPFREEFVDANVPDHKLQAIGHCPWCGAELTVDPNEVDGVCTSCGARYSTESALVAKPRTRRRWRRQQTEPPAPPEPDDQVGTPRRTIRLHRKPIDPETLANVDGVGTIFVAFVLPAVFTLIFAVFALRALVR